MDKILALPVSIIFLTLAVIFYAFFGSPTPDHPGLIEIIIGALLVLSVITGVIRGGLSFQLGRNIYLKSLQVLFLGGLILPTVSGVYHGNDMMLIVRDVIAFAFLGLPLFLSEKIAGTDGAAEIFRALLLFTGIAFAVRTLLPVFNVWIPEGELLYLSNSPLCLFAAVFFSCAIFERLLNWRSVNALHTVLLFAALCVILAAMLLDVQRATIGAVGLSVFFLALVTVIQTPRRAVVPILIIAVLCAVFYPMIGQALDVMAQKTASVGLNMRVQEAQAIIANLSAAPETFFVGRGWGAVFASPAVGGLDVNYTHSFLTTMMFKGGVILLLLAGICVIAAIHQIILIFQRDRAMALSLFWPLVIPVFLYASHKSLDFGLLLLAIGVWSVRRQALHHGHPSDKNHETL